VRYHITFLVSCLALAALLTLIGCNRNSSQSDTTASIGGADGKTAKSQTGGPVQSNTDLVHPEVAIETSLGMITIRLDSEKAPLTVDNFLAYVDAGLYDRTIFHQVYKGQGVLAGGYTASLAEIPSRTPIRNEADNGLKNRRGTISMVRQPDVIDSATSQFFINVADNPALDHRLRTAEEYGYCVFGEVISGMEVVDKITASPVQDTDKLDQTPVQTVVIKSVRRVK
jgi:peptidyl-prolyl cis-trans isomerase A (cyclophilin A)